MRRSTTRSFALAASAALALGLAACDVEDDGAGDDPAMQDPADDGMGDDMMEDDAGDM